MKCFQPRNHSLESLQALIGFYTSRTQRHDEPLAKLAENTFLGFCTGIRMPRVLTENIRQEHSRKETPLFTKMKRNYSQGFPMRTHVLQPN